MDIKINRKIMIYTGIGVLSVGIISRILYRYIRKGGEIREETSKKFKEEILEKEEIIEKE